MSKTPLSILGCAGRFPGGDDNLQSWWVALLQNADLTDTIPHSRFDRNAWPELPNRAALLKEPCSPDIKAFALTRSDAANMDPQQFLLLESTLSAVEDAGFSIVNMQRSLVAVFVGAMNQDFQEMMAESEIQSAFAAGAARSMMGAKVSFTFNFRGPSAVIDTACSSSLVAVHHGEASIRGQRSEYALCLGVNLLLNVKTWMGLQQAGMISERCRTFCAKRSGYGRGEGCGAIVLGPVTEGSRAHLLGTSVRSNGQSARPITMPSAEAQAQCMREAWGELQLACQHVESHGTGTSVGDPIEVSSLKEVFGRAKTSDGFPRVTVGGIKANTNHLESAAGMAGFLKTMLCMKKELHVPFGGGSWTRELNGFDFEAAGLAALHVHAVAWSPQRGGQHRYAGVNSFGFGGQNAHAAIMVTSDSAEVEHARKRRHTSQKALPMLTLSGSSREGLLSWASAVKEAAASCKDEACLRSLVQQSNGTSHPLPCADGTIRLTHLYRIAIPAQDKSALVDALGNPEIEEVKQKPLQVVFIACGNGNMKAGMMKGLCTNNAVRAKLMEIDNLLLQFPGGRQVKVWDWCNSNDAVPADLAVSQVLLFACQVAQAAMWEELGVKPDALAAHSAGETSAAVIGGFLSLQEGLYITLLRGEHQKWVSQGTMVAAACSKEDFDELGIADMGGELACLNTRDDVTISVCNPSNADKIVGHLKSARKRCKKLEVQAAFHSSSMDRILPHIRDSITPVLAGPKRSDTNCKFFSSITGDEVDVTNVRSPDFWVKGVRKEVLFAAAMENCFSDLKGDGSLCCIELGPGSMLSNYVEKVAGDREMTSVLSLSTLSDRLGEHQVVQTCAELWKQGYPVRLCGEARLAAPRTLPPRPFSRDPNVWVWPEQNKLLREQGPSVGALVAQPHQLHRHPYLGNIVTQRPDGSACRALQISREATPIVFDHLWQDKALVPGAVMADTAMSATAPQSWKQLSLEITFHQKAQVLEDKLLLTVCTFPDGRFSIRDDSATVYASGAVFACSAAPPALQLTSLQHSTMERPASEAYRALEAAHLTYGPLLHGIRRYWWDGQSGLAEVSVPEALQPELEGCVVPPALLDLCLQQISFFLVQDGKGASAVPVAIKRLVVHNAEAFSREMLAFFKVTMDAFGSLVFSGGLASQDGTVALEIQEGSAQLLRPGEPSFPLFQESFFKLALSPLEPPKAEAPGGKRFLILGDEYSYLVQDLVKTLGAERCRVLDQFFQFSEETDLSTTMVLYTWTGNSCHIYGERYYEKLLNDVCHLCSHVKNLHQLKKSVPFYVITANTRLVREQCTGEPAGGAFWGLVKNLINEDVLVNERGQSQLRLIDLHHQHDFPALAAELMAQMRSDSAEVVIQDGKPHRLEVLREEWSYSEMQAHMSAPRQLHGLPVSLVLECGSPVAQSPPLPAAKPMIAGDMVTVDVSSVLLQQLGLHDEEQGKLQMLDFKGKAGGEEVLCCFPTSFLQMAKTNVPRALAVPAKSLPANCVLSHLVLASTIAETLLNLHLEPPFCVKVDSACPDFSNSIYNGLWTCAKTDLLAESCGTKVLVSFMTEDSISHGEFQPSLVISLGGRCRCFPDVPQYHINLDDALQELRLLQQVPLVVDKIRAANHATMFEWEHATDVDQWWNEQHRSIAWLCKETTARVLHPRGKLFNVDASAAYLVTGALRPHGFGFLTAKFLEARGAQHVVLAGRSPPPANLPKLDCTTSLWQCDICDTEALAKRKREINDEGVRIAGVFHSAACFKMPNGDDTDGFFVKKHDLSYLDVVLRPKIQGTISLAKAFGRLEHFVIYSSVVSVFGNWGQAAYAAANNFQDCFALVEGATALNWGSLDNIGTLHNKADLVQSLQETRGFKALSLHMITHALEAALLLQRPQLAVAPMDWGALQGNVMIANPLVRGRFATLGALFAPQIEDSKEQAVSSFSDEEVRERLEQIFKLVLPPNAKLDLACSLPDMGLTSGDANSARQMIANKKLGVKVLATQLLDDKPLGELLSSIIASRHASSP